MTTFLEGKIDDEANIYLGKTDLEGIELADMLARGSMYK